MRMTISGDTRGIRRELREQIVFRHAQQSLPLDADWGDNKRESERAQNKPANRATPYRKYLTHQRLLAALARLHTACFRVRPNKICTVSYFMEGEVFGETRNAGTWPPPLVTLAKPVALRRVR